MDELKSITYYNEHAKEFFAKTINADMSEIYAHFLKYLPANGSILDAGFGSGRDSYKFSEMGFKVTAIDASETICGLTQEFLKDKAEVFNLTFGQLAFQSQFDGIWACASLLHVPEKYLLDALQKLNAALKQDGVLYASWKYGDYERVDSERFFCDMNEARIKKIIELFPEMIAEGIWISHDVCDYDHRQWLNVIIRRRE